MGNVRGFRGQHIKSLQIENKTITSVQGRPSQMQVDAGVRRWTQVDVGGRRRTQVGVGVGGRCWLKVDENIRCAASISDFQRVKLSVLIFPRKRNEIFRNVFFGWS